jgi:hypothetical protein
MPPPRTRSEALSQHYSVLEYLLEVARRCFLASGKRLGVLYQEGPYERATLKIHTAQCCGSVIGSPTAHKRYALSRC